MNNAGRVIHDPLSDRLIEEARRQAEAIVTATTSSSSADGGASTARMTVDPFKAVDLHGYQIIREIHRGGQGVVFQAVQESTERDVAIKVLHAGCTVEGADLGRLEREIGILREFSHPGVVPVQDIGIARGRRYLVMPYIVGRPVDEYVRDTDLNLHETLTLFARVCDAVQAAHLRGVMHRDLKPGNILVDDEGQPHVLDFGLAKFAEHDNVEPSITHTGHFVGSLPWASPEQAEGRRGVDLRTDVYSLGVILYQLVTGRLPVDTSGSMREALNRMAFDEPPHPRTLRPDLDDDVDVIIMTCLAKEPGRRYQSAGALADELRRFLAHRPIEARRDSFTYVAWKFVRRNRMSSGLTAALILVLLTAVPLIAALWRISESQRTLADQERSRALSQARNSQDLINIVRDVIGSVDLRTREHDENFLKAILSLNRFIDEIPERTSGQPKVESEMRCAVAWILYSLDRLDESAAQLAQSLAIVRRESGADSLAVADVLLQVAWVDGSRKHYRSAADQAVEALDILRKHHEAHSPQIARALLKTANYLFSAGDYAAAKALRDEALSQAPVDDTGFQILLAHLTDRFASIDAGFIDEARLLRERVINAARLTEDAAHLSDMLHGYAMFLKNIGALEEAESAAREGLRIRAEIYPEGDKDRFLYYSTMSVLGTILRLRGEYAAAEPYLLECFAGFDPPKVDNQTNTIRRFMVLDLVELYEAWDQAEPEKGYSNKVDYWRAQLPPENPLTAESEQGQADSNRPERH